jgi:hypothetical protein
MLGDSYTSKQNFIEKALIGITSLLLLLGLLNFVPLLYGSVLLLVSFLLTIPSSYKIFIKDKKVGIMAPFIIILRDFIMDIGIVFGLVISFIKSG